MRFRPIALALLVFLSVVAPAMAAPATAQSANQSCSFPVTVTDGSGTEITISEEPTRVVTLSPSAAQTMWEIGAREKVVGLTKYADYLEGAADRTQVSTTEQLVSFETVVDLEPDLVLAPNVVSPETVAQLRRAGLTVYHFPPAEDVEDVTEKTSQIGRLTGECGGAAETVGWMNDRIAVVEQAVAGQNRPGVLYLFFGYTAGQGTFIAEIIETAGGENIAVSVGVSGYQQLSQEVILQEDPEWIVLNSENPAGVGPQVLNRTTAIQENQTVVIPIQQLNQPAPRIVHAITTLAKAFHPEAYAAANATATPTTEPVTDSPTAAPTQAPETEPQTTAPGQPGFGVLAWLLAGSLVVLLRRT